MYVRYDTESGLPPRIYRRIGEIRRDMGEIIEKIKDTNSMLNIRGLLLDILTSARAENPAEIIPELYDTISEASEALDCLRKLNGELEMLKEELNETRCEIGI